jgi:hypothetical protein
MNHPQPAIPADETPTTTSDDCYLGGHKLVTYSGLSERTLRRYFKDPNHPLPHYRVNGRVLVRKSEFDQWIRQVDGRITAHGRSRNANFDARVAAAVKSIRG